MRLLAPIALIAAAVVVVVVVAGSLDGSDDGRDRDRPAREQSADEGPEEEFYVVEPGDSFSTIAEEQGVPEERLEQLNPDLDPQALNPGQRIKLR
jgi:LysM domain